MPCISPPPSCPFQVANYPELWYNNQVCSGPVCGPGLGSRAGVGLIWFA